MKTVPAVNLLRTFCKILSKSCVMAGPHHVFLQPEHALTRVKGACQAGVGVRERYLCFLGERPSEVGAREPERSSGLE